MTLAARWPGPQARTGRLLRASTHSWLYGHLGVGGHGHVPSENTTTHIIDTADAVQVSLETAPSSD